jgi:glutathione S-transferase
MDLWLYRCPFCKKVRAFLDFAGLSYDVVEVNPVTKKQLNWSAYKKVPIVVVKVKEGYQVCFILNHSLSIQQMSCTAIK